MAKVGLIMGSDSDWPHVKKAVDALEQFDVSWEASVASAHRAPERATQWARQAAGRGVRVVIAAAGLAAHLPGVVASHTTLPVIGLPIGAGALSGIDALYSIVQMPPGVPVATMAVGPWGARNAGVLAVQILSRRVPELRAALHQRKRKMAEDVEAKAKALERQIKS